MKKKTLVSAVLAATIMGTASVTMAAENMFSDVPLEHWAYDAVNKLAEDGIIDGYGDTNFGGDKPITRYEMAQLVEKAMQNQENARAVDKAAIEKLQKEFDSELKGEVQSLRKDVDDLKSRMGWYGDARIRYFANKDQKGNNGKNSNGETSQFEKRLRLGFWANPAENLTVDGRLKYEDKSWQRSHWTNGHQNFNSWDNSYDNQNSLRLDKLSLNWEHAGTKASIGRTEVKLGEGLIWWENQVDGAYVKHQFGPKVSAMLGVGDISAEGWHDSNINAQFGEIAVQTSPATKVAVSNMRTLTDVQKYTSGTNWAEVSTPGGGTTWVPSGTWSKWEDDAYKLNQYSLSVNTQIAPKWNVIAEAVTNNVGTVPNANKHGVWTRVTYGKMDWKTAKDWQVYGEYFALGNTSVDSSKWGHRLNIAGGDGFGGHGARGFGINLDYMVANNTCLGLNYYKLKPYDENAAGFSKYDDVATVALSYMF